MKKLFLVLTVLFLIPGRVLAASYQISNTSPAKCYLYNYGAQAANWGWTERCVGNGCDSNPGECRLNGQGAAGEYLYFDLSGISEPITTATITINGSYYYHTNYPDLDLNFFRITSETPTTSTGLPTYSDMLGGTTAINSLPRLVNVSETIIESMRTGTNHGIYVVMPDNNQNYGVIMNPVFTLNAETSAAPGSAYAPDDTVLQTYSGLGGSLVAAFFSIIPVGLGITGGLMATLFGVGKLIGWVRGNIHG